jgi:hypothetical protein
MTVGSNGNLYVSDGNNVVLSLNPNQPLPLTFAATQVNTIAGGGPQTVTVVNQGNESLAFSAVTYPSNFPEASGVSTDCTPSSTLLPGATCTLSVNFSPLGASATVPGTQLNQSVSISDNNLNGTDVVQSVAATGTAVIGGGSAPTISFSIPEKHTADAAFSVAASSNSSGAISYSLVSGPATVTSGGLVTLSGTAGTVSIQASQQAAGSYSSGTVTASFNVGSVSVWLANGAGSLGEFDLSGNPFSATAFTGGGLGTVSGSGTIAFDASANSWVANANGITEFNFDGTPVVSTAYTGGGVSSPSGLAIDGNGSVWVANSNGTVSELSNSGTAISPSTGYLGTSGTVSGGIAIDLSGNVWVTNTSANTITEIIGGAAPIAPASTALAKGTTGARP